MVAGVGEARTSEGGEDAVHRRNDPVLQGGEVPLVLQLEAYEGEEDGIHAEPDVRHAAKQEDDGLVLPPRPMKSSTSINCH